MSRNEPPADPSSPEVRAAIERLTPAEVRVIEGAHILPAPDRPLVEPPRRTRRTVRRKIKLFIGLAAAGLSVGVGVTIWTTTAEDAAPTAPTRIAERTGSPRAPDSPSTRPARPSTAEPSADQTPATSAAGGQTDTGTNPPPSNSPSSPAGRTPTGTGTPPGRVPSPPPVGPAANQLIANPELTGPGEWCDNPCRVGPDNADHLRSAAKDWYASLSGSPTGYVDTKRVPTNVAGRTILQVCTSGGLLATNPYTNGVDHPRMRAWAWIWVQRGGPVRMSLNVLGQGGQDDVSSTHGQWELLDATVGRPRADQFILAVSGPGCFYVGSAGVQDQV